MSNVFNVKTPYGALGNGSNDDTTAIQSAINSAQAAGGVVFFPPGTYQISSNLTITAQGVHLVGAGRLATTLRPTAGFSNSQMIYVSGGSLGAITNMSFAGMNSSYTANPACNGIQLNSSNDFYLQNLYFNFLNGWCVEVADTGGSYYCSFLNIRMGTVKQGIHLQSHSGGAGSGAYLANCFVSGQNGDGLFIDAVADVTVVNLEGGNSGTGGSTIHIAGDSHSLFFSNADIGALVGGAAYSQPQLLIEASGGHSPADVHFTGGILEAGTPNVSITAGSNIQFIGTRFFKGGTHGISISGSTDLMLIDGCEFDTNGWTAAAGNYDMNWSSSGHCKVVDSFFSTPGGSAQGQVTSAGNFTAGTSEVTNCSFLGASVFTGFASRTWKCAGYNPLGAITPPSVPASGASTSGFGTDMTVYIKGGTLTDVKVGGTTTGISAAAPAGAVHTIRVPAGLTVSLTYSVAPTWTWFGD